MGGTFDPPHGGHLAAAEAALEQLGLDRVLLVVANVPWQKTALGPITPAEDRLAMVRCAVEGHPGLEASDLEIRRGGPSYTIDTVHELEALAAAAGRPGPELFVVIGADLVPSLPSWHRFEELAALVTLAVVSRPHAGVPEPPPGARWCEVQGVDVDVSSSELRDRLAGGHPVAGLAPDPVIRCIERRGLYARSR